MCKKCLLKVYKWNWIVDLTKDGKSTRKNLESDTSVAPSIEICKYVNFACSNNTLRRPHKLF